MSSRKAERNKQIEITKEPILDYLPESKIDYQTIDAKSSQSGRIRGGKKSKSF